MEIQLFLHYPSHHNIYKLYFNFNCCKFVVGETNLPTYLALHSEPDPDSESEL